MNARYFFPFVFSTLLLTSVFELEGLGGERSVPGHRPRDVTAEAALSLSSQIPYQGTAWKVGNRTRREILRQWIAILGLVRVTSAQTQRGYDPKKILDRALQRIGGAQALRRRFPEFDRAVSEVLPEDDQALQQIAKAFIVYLLVKDKGFYGHQIAKDAHEEEDYFRETVIKAAGGPFKFGLKMVASDSSRKSLERSAYRRIAEQLTDSQSLANRLLVKRRAENSEAPLRISLATANIHFATLVRYLGLTDMAWDPNANDWTQDGEFLTTDRGRLQQVVKLQNVPPFRMDLSEREGFCVGVISPEILPTLRAQPLQERVLSAALPHSEGNNGLLRMLRHLGTGQISKTLQNLRTFTGLGPVVAPYWLRLEDEDRIVAEIERVRIPVLTSPPQPAAPENAASDPGYKSSPLGDHRTLRAA